jgi:hypothetical protein
MADGNSPDGDQQQRQLERIRREADKLPQGTDEHPAEPDVPPDRTRQFSHVNFSRMRTEWLPADKIKMAEIGRLADDVLATVFADAWWLTERLYRVVREPVIITSSGEIMKDAAGHIRWKRNEAGFYIEHWDRIGDRERDDFLHELAIHMIEWRQQAAAMWGSAMFAKGIWEEAFAWGYTSAREEGRRLTIDDRTQAGHLAGIEDRYFAIFQSVLSRRADALIRSLERLEDMLIRASRI